MTSHLAWETMPAVLPHAFALALIGVLVQGLANLPVESTPAHSDCLPAPLETAGHQLLDTCKTDNGHGDLLTTDSPDADQPVFPYQTDRGVQYRFERASVQGKLFGRRKWLMTAINEGHARPNMTGLGAATSGWTTLRYAGDVEP